VVPADISEEMLKRARPALAAATAQHTHTHTGSDAKAGGGAAVSGVRVCKCVEMVLLASEHIPARFFPPSQPTPPSTAGTPAANDTAAAVAAAPSPVPAPSPSSAASTVPVAVSGAVGGGPFEVIYSFDVFPHIDLHTTFAYLKQFKRLLSRAPHAALFLHTSNLESAAGWDRFSRQTGHTAGGFYFVTADKVRLLAQRTGFRVARMSNPTPDASERNMYYARDLLFILQHAD
jgi:hypothetical protein